MSDRIYIVRKAIDNIMNDVMQKAYHHSINHPQDSDYLNNLIRDIRIDSEHYVNTLHRISTEKNEVVAEDELQVLTKSLKKKSLLYLSELQKLKEKDAPQD